MIRPGTIGLARIRGFVGLLVWIAQALNGDLSRWTHVFVVLDDDDVFEAQPGGAIISPLSKYDNRKREAIFINFPVEDEKRPGIVATARNYTGIGYNWNTYLYLAAYRLRIPGLTALLRKRVENDDRLICSQAADRIYKENGIELFPERRAYDVTPGDFRQLVKEWGAFTHNRDALYPMRRRSARMKEGE